MKYEVVIGLEMHIQMKTKTKMFCGCSNKDTEEPNINVCPVCMGHPGTLPVLNDQALDLGMQMAHALGLTINPANKFDRKHYFYPDLPKGYQISQYDVPLAEDGRLTVLVNNRSKRQIRIERLHLEEDSAKNIHLSKSTLVDFNRAGTPLMELVTKPDIKTPQEAKAFLQEVQKIARYLKISDADMEKGHLRCDGNISLRPKGESVLYPKTEIKNLNSFKALEHALEYEIKRQTELWDDHKAPEKEETRGWSEDKGETISQRVKETLADYRYFPEPDLPPLNIPQDRIDFAKRSLPEMPTAKKERFKEEYDLSYHDAGVLVADPQVAEYYERTISELKAWLFSLDETEGSDEQIWRSNRKKMARMVYSWLTTEIFALQKAADQDFADLKISPENLGEFITLIYQNKLNSSAAQTVLKHMFDKGSDPSMVMDEEDLEQVQDLDTIEALCDQAIKENDKVVQEYKGGNDRVLMYIVGQVMKQSKGKANPQFVTDILRDKLK